MSDEKNVFGRADEFLTLFKQGADFTKELLEENERLRHDLLQIQEGARAAASDPGEWGKLRVQLLGSGAILREVLAAAELLERDYDVAADVWSVTSFNELHREGLEAQRWNRLHPEQPPRLSYVEQCLGPRRGPVIASTDYMALYADQIRVFQRTQHRQPPSEARLDHVVYRFRRANAVLDQGDCLAP